jgi:putative flippase GtrA
MSGGARGELALFLKFGLVGGGGFLVDALVLQAGLAMSLEPAAARAVSVLVAMHATFLANDTLVFREHRVRALPARWAGYLLANSFGAACNYLVFLVLTGSGAPVLSQPLAALAIGSAVGWGVNYAGSRMLAYRRRPGG